MSFEEASSKLLEEICIKPGCVLDVGTGSGRVALVALKPMGGRGCVIGVDILRNVVERAHQRGVEEGSCSTVFLQGCCEQLPFRDECLMPSTATSV